jgi:hypothetical protein
VRGLLGNICDSGLVWEGKEMGKGDMDTLLTMPRRELMDISVLVREKCSDVQCMNLLRYIQII